MFGVCALVFYCQWKQERWSGLAAIERLPAWLIAGPFASPGSGVVGSSQAWRHGAGQINQRPHRLGWHCSTLAGQGFSCCVFLALLFCQLAGRGGQSGQALDAVSGGPAESVWQVTHCRSGAGYLDISPADAA